MMARVTLLDALLEGFDSASHPRGPLGRWIATFHHSVHGTMTSPIEARSSAEAHSKAQAHARESSGERMHMTLQSVAPHDSNALQIMHNERKYDSVGAAARAGALASQQPAGRGMVRPTGQKFDSIGAAARAGQLPSQQRTPTEPSVTHAKVRGYLENLPEGRYFHIGGLGNGGALARKTGAGIEVYRANQAKPEKVHKTPTAAAAHMVRIRNEGVRESAPVAVLGALLEGADGRP